MDILASTVQKTEAMLETVRNLQAAEFPQADASDVLGEIEGIFLDHQRQLQDLSSGGAPNAEAVYCATVLEDLFIFLPLLGFLHRSKNASNAFEMHGPLRRMAKDLIGPNTKLVLSSEWEFSPFTMLEIASLPNIVLIGLPATECANVLLVPLAGHEFGHAIWLSEKGRNIYQRSMADAVVEDIRIHWNDYNKHFPDVADGTLTTDIFAQQTWLPALRWSLRQSEEVFCDLVGLRTFGASYFHAFAYLLAPGMPGRQPFYPTDRQRASYLIEAADQWKIDVPPSFQGHFKAGVSGTSTVDDFLLDTADRATGRLVPRLIDHVNNFCTGKRVFLPDKAEVDQIFQAFRSLVPSANPPSLAAIVNAGWRAVHDGSLWSEYPKVLERKNLALNELMRKTAQVLEVSQLLALT